jgi:subtilisin family serine protease
MLYCTIWLRADRCHVLLVILLLSFVLIPFGVQGQNRKQPQRGIIHLKVSEGMSKQLASAKFGRTANQDLETGIKTLDAVNKKFRVSGMKRLFPYAGKFEEKHRKYGLHRWYVVDLDKSVTVQNAIQEFRRMKEIEKAEPVYAKGIIGSDRKDFGPVRVNTTSTTISLPDASNDPRLVSQWHYDNTGQTGGTISSDINLFDAWKDQTGNANVVVSIHDGGIDVDHEDLAANIWINDDEVPGNGIDDDENGYIDDVNGYNFPLHHGPIRTDNHGTHVAGTIAAATHNGIGVAGVAGGSGSGDGVRVMSCEVFGEFSYEGFAESYVYAADNGAVISQNSWGYLGVDDYEPAVLDGILYFINEAGTDEFGNQVGPMKGGLVIFAAGNSNSSENYYPAYYSPVLAVAGTTHEDKKAWYSNYGSWVDIAAPGGETNLIIEQGVLSTLPDNTYGYFQGTSMACPHVSGVAALVLSKFGATGFTPDDLRARLVSSTENIDSSDPTYAGQLGSGRLDAAAALASEDGTPPAAIQDLAIFAEEQHAIELLWHAPADDANKAAKSYDLRYSTTAITNDNFAQAKKVSGLSFPKAPGGEEKFKLEGLTAATTYYFAVKSADANGNLSGLSNVISGSTTAGPLASVSPTSISQNLVTATKGTTTLRLTNDEDGYLLFSFTVPSEGFIERPVEGRIEAHQAMDVAVTLDATGKRAGSYLEDLIVNTNDPARPAINVPCTINVTNNGFPIAVASPAVLDFGRTMVSTFGTLPLKITNNGSESLVISELSIDNPEFTHEVSLPLTVAAFQSVNITVKYTPVNSGLESEGTLTLNTNDPQTPLINVACTGTAITPPILFFQQSEINAFLYKYGNHGESFIVSNDGDAELTFTAQAIYDDGVGFFDFAPTEGTIDPHTEIFMQINIGAGDLNPGIYTGKIRFTTNMPENEVVDLPVNLTVYGPQFVVTPQELKVELAAGDSVTRTLSITNTGDNITRYDLAIRHNSIEAAISQTQLQKSAQPMTAGELDRIIALTEHLKASAKEKKSVSKDLLKSMAAFTPRTFSTTPVYATDFEDFTSDDPNEFGWTASELVSVSSADPFSGSKHLRLVSSHVEGQVARAPYIARNPGAFSTLSLRMKIERPGSVAHVVPISSQTSTALFFWPFGPVDVLIDDGSGNGDWRQIDEPMPIGYFELTIQIERANRKLTIFFDGREVFQGLALDSDILWSYQGVDTNSDATIFDIDDYRLQDGEKDHAEVVRVTPDVGYIGAGETTQVNVTFDASGLIPAQYLSDIIVYGFADKIVVPTTLSVSAPEVQSLPRSLSEELKKGESDTTTLLLVNNGASPHSFEIEIRYPNDTTAAHFLTVLPVNGKIEAGDSASLEVLFKTNAILVGSYSAEIVIKVPGLDDQIVPVALTIIGEPEIEVSPLQIDIGAYFQSTANGNLIIGNSGDGLLIYETSIVIIDSLGTDPGNWLGMSQSIGEPLPGVEDNIDLYFDAHGMEPGMYHAVIQITSNDSDNPQIDIPVLFTILRPGKIVVLPDSIDEKLYSGTTSSRTVEVRNDGESRVEYTISVIPEQPQPGVKNLTTRIYPLDDHLSKNTPDLRKGHPVLTGQGGPDSFGYNWSDSDEPGGPVFAWVDISTTGTGIYLEDDDYYPLNLPFVYEYYGFPTNTLSIHSNGYLAFVDDGTSYYDNQEIPNSVYGPQGFVAPLWDDLLPGEGVIYYQEFADKFVVQYDRVSLYLNQTKQNTFQVIINKDGSIVFQYLDMSDELSATIGMENLDGSDGLQIAFNTPYVHNNLAVKISPPGSVTWLQPNAVSGILYPGDVQELNLDFNTTDLSPGQYNATLNILSSMAETRVNSVKVRLNVFDNYAPQIDSIAEVSVIETQSRSMVFTATDRDDPEITVSLIDPPAFVSLKEQSNGSATYVFSPFIGASGDYPLRINAVDSRGMTSVVEIILHVVPYGVESFSVVDLRNGQVVKTFTDTVTINRRDPGFAYWVLRANTNPSTVGSVEFTVNGKEKHGTKTPPYLLDDLRKWKVGSYKLRAQPFTAKSGKGTPGKALESTIMLIDRMQGSQDPDVSSTIVLSMYPKPVDHDLTFGVIGEIQGNVDVVVLDGTGNPVIRRIVTGNKLNGFQIDVSALMSGVYYVRLVYHDNTHLTERIIKR